MEAMNGAGNDVLTCAHLLRPFVIPALAAKDELYRRVLKGGDAGDDAPP